MKLKVTFVIALFGLFSSYAQEFNFGVKAGINYSIYTDDGNSVDGFGFHVGGVMGVGLSDAFNIRAELLLSDRGVQESSTATLFGTTYDSKYTRNTLYFAIPVLYQFNVSDQFSLFAGPQFSFLISNRVRTRTYIGNDLFTDITYDGLDAKDFLRNFEVGLAIGGEYNFTDNMGIGLRYMRAVQSYTDSDNATDFYNGIQASFLYKF